LIVVSLACSTGGSQQQQQPQGTPISQSGQPTQAPAAAQPTITPPTPTLTSLNRALIGTWVGESSDGQSTAITFEDSGQFSITVGTDVEKGTYTADFSFRPGHLDIEGTWTQGSKVTTIIEFVDDNHIRIGDIQPGQTRPATFSNSAITLSRQ
jgi:hypothetical protein